MGVLDEAETGVLVVDKGLSGGFEDGGWEASGAGAVEGYFVAGWHCVCV